MLLQLNSNDSYSVLINGKTTVSDTDIFVYNANCQGPVCDSGMTFYGPQSYGNFDQFAVLGVYVLHIRHDSLIMNSDDPPNPGGTSTTLKFIAYP